MITKETEVVRFSVHSEDKVALIKQRTVFTEDSVDIATTYCGCICYPGDTVEAIAALGAESPEMAYLNTIWTAQVVADYLASQGL